ncbi:hypothetical protein CCM_08554 [Cordyceps militaris CM01]|uniref:Uncharacterized protein n=1 Tax=Cordyceps militaris (strain CM01) TaxID=983644 RepID=G3JRG0_CORMM|nr:uncharacterized protein CCM_08554 [Cordyceps militaris CM01]EGX88510.1 hypothetical protein CCM_08554 [Cordyceps militaris CM01]
MFSFCGCSSRRRAKQNAIPYSKAMAPEVKACLRPSGTMTHGAVDYSGDGRLSLDDFGVQISGLPKRKSSNALETVKNKLIRHLSIDKDPPPKSQVSSPDSDEEVARRAELRRFRARRIQEELYQDHSSSLSPHVSIRSTRYLLPLIDIGRPGRGPRDAIEFSIDSGSHMPAIYPSPMHSPEPLKRKTPNPTVKRWSSCPAVIREQRGQIAAPIYNNSNTAMSRKRYTIPSRLSESKSLPNLLQPNMKAPQVARTKIAAFGSDDYTAVDAWLVLQESRSRASPASGATKDILKYSGSRRTYLKPSNKIPTEFSDDTVTVPYPIRQSGTSRLPSASLGATQQCGSQKISSSKPASANRSQVYGLAVPPGGKKKTSSSSSQGRIPHSETTGGLSSYYPSVIPSIQPSPSRSKSLVNVLTVRDLESLELSPFEWHGDNFGSFGTSSEGHSSYATADNGENNNDSVNGCHDGQADEITSHRFVDPLNIRKRREHDTITSSRSNPIMNRLRAERAGLPTIWRSGSGSWKIQARLPKRISSRFWYQTRTASATIPEGNPEAQ